MPNYQYVTTAQYHPYTMQEMLTPFLMYKEAYEKDEQDYLDYIDKMDTFKYLEEVAKNNPNSKAAQIYKGYADEMNTQFDDFINNGLNPNNRRGLTRLKRRYKGEIGRLESAKKAMDAEKERRLANNDTSMLYGEDNLTIDQFLDDNTPNLYKISGNELYNKGALVGKNFSSRIFDAGDGGQTLGGYYREYIQRMGYTPEQLSKFSDEILNDFTATVSVLPELQKAAWSILEANGATKNLKDNNLRAAQQQVIRGIVDNAVYTEDHKPYEDRGVMSRSAAAQYALQRDQMNMTAELYGLEKVGDKWKTKPEIQAALDSGLVKRDSSGRIVPVTGNGGSNVATDAYQEGIWHFTNSGEPKKLADNERPDSRAVELMFEQDSDGTITAYVKKLHTQAPSNPDLGKIGSITRNGEIKLSDDKKLSEYIGSTMSTTDPDNIRRILGEVRTMNNNIRKSYNNYIYYLDPDASSRRNHGGGWWRERLKTQSVREDNGNTVIVTPRVGNVFDPTGADGIVIGE